MIVIVGTAADRIQTARCTYCDHHDEGVLVIPPELLDVEETIDDFVEELRKIFDRSIQGW